MDHSQIITLIIIIIILYVIIANIVLTSYEHKMITDIIDTKKNDDFDEEVIYEMEDMHAKYRKACFRIHLTRAIVLGAIVFGVCTYMFNPEYTQPQTQNMDPMSNTPMNNIPGPTVVAMTAYSRPKEYIPYGPNWQ